MHNYVINRNTHTVCTRMYQEYKYVQVCNNQEYKYNNKEYKYVQVHNNLNLYNNNLKSILSRDLLKTLHYSLIHPYFQYCNIIWGAVSKLALNRLICLQKRAMRLLTNSCYRTSSNPLFQRLGILKVNDIHRLQVGSIYVYSKQ